MNSNCSCECNPGYTGSHCQEPLICILRTPSGVHNFISCENEGIPQGNTGYCSCECTSEYKGITCDTHKFCPDLSCENGGEIIYDPDSTYPCSCECAENYKGETCNIFDNCPNFTCENQGDIVYEPNDDICSCECLDSYTGSHSQEQLLVVPEGVP